MKKSMKILALAGAVLCSGAMMVGCGGNGDLVDTKGNYVPASQTSVNAQTYVDEMDNATTEQNYKIKVKSSINSSEANIDFTANGVVGESGIYFDSTAKGNYTSLAISANVDYAMTYYYETAEQMCYVNLKGANKPEIKKATSLAGLTDEELPVDTENFSPESLKETLDSLGLTDENLAISQQGGTTKLKYALNDELMGNYEFCLIFDESGFYGAKMTCTMTTDGTSVSQEVQMVRTNEAVKTLSADQKSEYAVVSVKDFEKLFA